MEEIKLTDDVIEQIKDFNHELLTIDQKILIDKLILNGELKNRYRKYGLCNECKQPYISCDRTLQIYKWCQSCNAKRFQQNFKNWTSDNHVIDEFIQNAQLKAKFVEGVIEWIEYDRFEDVKYLAKGGFGITYKATWKDGPMERWDSENNQWIRGKSDKDVDVALKSLLNSQNITVDFMREVGSHIQMNESTFIVRCYGISKNPETNNFIIVMNYAKNGNLRHNLNDNFGLLSWANKLAMFWKITSGLEAIHDNKLIHRDFHSGNILSDAAGSILITDLGLCRPADAKSDDNERFGVIPYVAPEILRGYEYTQASDIYGFGIIAYEVCTGLPPYHDMAYDEFLANKICREIFPLRPTSNYEIPELILHIIKLCWDADPLNRPEAKELKNAFWKLHIDAKFKENSLMYLQNEESDENNIQISSASSGNLSYTSHPQASYVSKALPGSGSFKFFI